MNPITVSELDTLEQIEAALREIEASEGASLQVNKDSVNKYLGALHDASRLQFLLTWARKTKDPYLCFHASNKAEAVIDALCEYAPGISVLRLSEGLRVGEVEVSRRRALEGAVKKMEDTDEFLLSKIIHGRSIDLTCVSGAKVQYLRPLFHSRSPKSVKSATELYRVFKALNEQINQNDSELISDDFWRASGSFADALFKNTQEHALTDHAGLPYAAHVEGLIVSWKALEADKYASDFTGHERLKRFWEQEAVPVQGGTTMAMRCLQLSFFDSGPGFASRASGKTIYAMSLDEERAEFMKCLSKSFTTKNQAGAGGGIPDVLTVLKSIGGLIRIRSGRHSMFNVFGAKDDTDIFDFSDWTQDRLAPVTGAVITLLVPLRRA